MPKVVSYTPAWLSKPNPGHDIFTTAVSKAKSTHATQSNGFNSSTTIKRKPGAHRSIARRGTEVFIAVGKEIRWADLVYLKEAWEDKESTKVLSKRKGRDSSNSQYSADHAQGYRTIKTPVADDIRQLIISPHANYIAILTTHTVHISILPESSQLTAPDTGYLKLKTYTLGPTTHVTSQPGIASALWHPLGVNGTCLVTVTEDAVVRLWELSTADRWSFDRPTLAIDLKKLADGISVDQDFGASTTGTSNGFSPDSFEMEVASACFAGRGSGGWSPMTLWIAMREGDVYALCPLLPEKWSPPPTLIPSLSVSIVAKVAEVEDDPSVSQRTKMLAQQQLAWMSEIDIQEPMHIESPAGEPPAEVYVRPGKPGRVPRLQGPFEFELAPEESEEELDNLLSDIYVIGAKLDADELMFGEEDDLDMDEVDQEGLSVGVVCVLTSSGRLSICLDLDGVEAQWLPKTKSKVLRLIEEVEPPSLLTFEVLDTSRDGEVWESNWPVFSHDVNSRYSFYITDTSSVTFVSLSPWVFRLQTELSEATPGTDFRIDLLAKGQNTVRERLYTQKPLDRSSPLTASTLIRDPDLGYFLLTATPYGPIGLTFETPDLQYDFDRSQSRSPTYDPEPDKPLILCEPRPVYEPSHTLSEDSAIPAFFERLHHTKYKRLLNEEVRLSPATLQILTDAHKVMSEETYRVGTAAAEIFRRCERLQIDLRNHIKKANDVAARVEVVTGDDAEEGSVVPVNESVEARLEAVTNTQKKLNERLEKVRRRATKGTSRELSDKERAWMEEVKTLSHKVLGIGEARQTDTGPKEPYARYEDVKTLIEMSLKEAKDIQVDETAASGGVRVPSEIRKAKVAQIMSLLERQSALVDAARNRMETLNLS